MSAFSHDEHDKILRAARKQSSGFAPRKKVSRKKALLAKAKKTPKGQAQPGHSNAHAEPQQQQQQQQQPQQQHPAVSAKRSVDKVSESTFLSGAADAVHPLRSEATPLPGLTMFRPAATSPMHKRVALVEEPGLQADGVAAFSLSPADVAEIAQDFVHPAADAVGGWSDFVFECDAAPLLDTAATLQRILDTLSNDMNCGPRIFRDRKEIHVEMLRQRCHRTGVVLRLRKTKSGGLECAMARASGAEEAAFDLLMDLQQLSGLNKRGLLMRSKRSTTEPLVLACCAKDSSDLVDPVDVANTEFLPKIVVADVVASICALRPYFTLRAVDGARQFAQAACFGASTICPSPLAYLGSLGHLVAALPKHVAAADEAWDSESSRAGNASHEVVLSLFVGLALLAAAAGQNEVLAEDMVQTLSDHVVGPMLRFCEMHARDIVGSREVLAHVPALVNAHPTLRKHWLTRAVTTCNLCKQQPLLQRTADQARRQMLSGPGDARGRPLDTRRGRI